MKRVKSVLLAASLMLALAFTLFACSSDKEEDSGFKVACQQPAFVGNNYSCIEWPNEAEWEEFNKKTCEEDEDFKGTVKNKCPKGEKLKCNGDALGFKEESTVYFYGPLFEGESCESLRGNDDDD